MKKFLIAVLLLIPMVVVLSIVASSAIITLSGTPINPESMEVKDEFNVDISGIMEMDFFSGNEFISIYVYPLVAQDRSVTFTKVEDSGLGEVEFIKTGDNEYTIVPVAIGVAEYIIRPTANVSIYKSITFNITSDLAENVAVYNAAGDELGNEYEIVGQERLYAEALPLSSMDSVKWISGDTSVVYVDANGVLYPTGRGVATVQAQLYDKRGNMITKSLVINTKYAVATYKVAYCDEEITADWVLNNVALDSSDTTVTDLGSGRFALSANIGDRTVEDIVLVENFSSGNIDFIDNLEEIYLNYCSEFLQVGYPNARFNPFESVSFSSSDMSVATITSEGKIVPVGVGNCTVTANFIGKQISKSITVKERPAMIKLSLGAADAARGIERTRVWGTYTYEGSTLTEGVDLSLASGVKNYDLVWSSNGTGEMIENADGTAVEIKFGDDDLGKGVTVGAMLKQGERLIKSVAASFTFNVVSEKNAVNIYDFEGYKAACDVKSKQLQYVLQNDIVFEEFITTRDSIYGNGFVLDGSQLEYVDRYDTVLLYENYVLKQYSERYSEMTEIFVRNVKVICHKYDEFSFEENILGECIKFGQIELPCKLLYSEMEYANLCVECFRDFNVTIEGCIFGDAIRGGIIAQCNNVEYVESLSDYPYEFTLRNNVFKKSGSTSVGFNTCSAGDYTKDYMPILNLEGFFDCYNWKTEEELPDMFLSVATAAISSAKLNLDSVMKMLSSTIEDLIEHSTMSTMYIKYKGQNYCCPACVIMGMLYKVDLTRVNNQVSNLKSAYLTFEETPMINAIDQLLPKVLSDVKTVKNTSMMLIPTFENSDTDITPDTAVPNSEELYAHLRGEI